MEDRFALVAPDAEPQRVPQLPLRMEPDLRGVGLPGEHLRPVEERLRAVHPHLQEHGIREVVLQAERIEMDGRHFDRLLLHGLEGEPGVEFAADLAAELPAAAGEDHAHGARPRPSL